MKQPPRAIIFDLDGTLLDTITDIANCANKVLSDWGLPTFPVTTYSALVGDGLTNLARKALPEPHRDPSSISAFVEDYRVLYSQRWNETSKPYPGILELLDELAARSIPLAVFSNKRDDFTKVCVASFFPNIPFGEVRGERAGTPIKPDPTGALEIARALRVDPSQCLLVGDSEIDIATSLNAGMRNVGVLWGFRPQEVLEKAGAHTLISRPAELLSVMDQHES